ncbi:ParA family protein [Candidatus Magnetomonas plexicatena]|uniref:ParA family protein n=1 Tax=Candidatus Magnetomonas plexicatena TaxID=2552947 RepID=UPI001C788A0A|nr:ParA family protein [Nitrospirales bacterium LBB_01]
MSKTIAITNQKGGVGKTTVSVNLAAGLSKAGKKTLLVDVDAQGNASASVGLMIESGGKTVKDLLTSGGSPRDFITTVDSLEIIPANNALKDMEETLVKNKSFDVLKKALAPIVNDYDYIVIDCPPSINAFTKNALTMAEHIIIPVDVGYFSILGLKQLLEEIELEKKILNPALSILGVLACKFDRRTSLSQQVFDTLRESFPDKLFKTTIRLSIDIVRSQIQHKSVLDYNPKSLVAQDFQQLIEEILNG